MSRKGLRQLVECPTACYQLREERTKDEVRWDVHIVVPFVFLTTEADAKAYHQREGHDDELLVFETGSVYGWVCAEEDEQYGPFAYARFLLAFNGLDEVSKQRIFYDPSRARQGFLEMMERNVGQHVSAIWRGRGYHLAPSRLRFREQNAEE